MVRSLDSLNTKSILHVKGKNYTYYSLKKAEKKGLCVLSTLPYLTRILLENLLRTENGKSVCLQDMKALCQLPGKNKIFSQIGFSPARVLMQDLTGVPALVDLAAMRDTLQDLGRDVEKINPLIPVDLVIDHSLMVDYYGHKEAFHLNVALEFKRNQERYTFLKWAQKVFKNFRVVPPGTGICHQVNLEHLAQCVWTRQESDGTVIAYPDTLVGTDSHTTMVNAMAVLGWGVGGIEAEAAMLGQPLSLLIPQVVGCKLKGKLGEGVTATDLVLTITQLLRTKNVVGKFVEFFGVGLQHLSIADRATIANMAPEYGATSGFFPLDQETLSYLKLTARPQEQIDLVEAYAKEQALWYEPHLPDPVYDESLEIDLSTIRSTLAGPKRPQDKIDLSNSQDACLQTLAKEQKSIDQEYPVAGKAYTLRHAHVVIAAITSCTNTSNPFSMLGAGLLARKAHQLGLQPKPWVKTSLAPGSQVVTDYLKKSGLIHDLESIGYYLVGYGCTTCIGNSGPLNPEIGEVIEKNDMAVACVLSGNRNFEGRINPHVKLNYLASPLLVIAYALAGTMVIDFTKDPLGLSKEGVPVYLRDIWPSSQDIQKTMSQFIMPTMFIDRYADVFSGETAWQQIEAEPSKTFEWDTLSTYIKKPPYFTDLNQKASLRKIKGAKILALLGDSVTTDHISPAGTIKKESPAGEYLLAHSVNPFDFNSYGSRRGNHEVMIRGTFSNIRLINEMVPEKTGGYTRVHQEGKILSIYDAAMHYSQKKYPLVVIAGKEYGTGSSRDWAAKGTRLLGVRAVIAESFERIHRSNLVGMGVLPLVFPEGVTRKTLSLTGFETITLTGLNKVIIPGMKVSCEILYPDGTARKVFLTCRIDTQDEVDYFKNDGILPYVLKILAAS